MRGGCVVDDARMDEREGERTIEAGVRTDLAGTLSYGDYLDLDRLLSAQHPVSRPEHHDELLFIIAHQTTELWFRLVLHELRAVRDHLDADDPARARKGLARVKHIFRTLAEQWSVLATLTPSEYAEFRGSLGGSSGFQSAQYRAVEFILGNKNAGMLAVFDAAPAAQAVLAELLDSPTVYDAFLAHLSRRGHAVPAAILDRDVRQAWTMQPDLVPVLRRIYDDADRALGRVRRLRGPGGHRGRLPVLAVPAPAHRAAHDRLRHRHRRQLGGRVPAPGAGPDLLPRALRRAQRHRGGCAQAVRRCRESGSSRACSTASRWVARVSAT